MTAQPLSRNTLASQMQQMKKLKNEFNKEAGLHTLRHSFLTECGRYAQNIKALQRLAGHANIATTMGYCHPDASDIIDTQYRAQAAREARLQGNLGNTGMVPTEVPTVQ